MIWFGFTIISPFLAFVCWYAKGKGKLAFMLSILILAVLFNMTFVYGWGYFEALSVLELAVFIIGLTVLRRDTLRSSVLMGTISIVLHFYLIWSFHSILDKQLTVCQIKGSVREWNRKMPDYENDTRRRYGRKNGRWKKVLDCYGDEINHLAMVKKRQPDGTTKEEIDEDLRQTLILKLLEAIPQFPIERE